MHVHGTFFPVEFSTVDHLREMLQDEADKYILLIH